MFLDVWMVFSCEFCKISKNTFLQNTSPGCFCNTKYWKKIQQYRSNSNKNIQKKAEVLGEEAVARYEKPKLEDQGKICGMYLEEVTGHENCKTKKNKLNNKIKTVCYKCKHAVCTKKHTVIIRQKCHEEIT